MPTPQQHRRRAVVSPSPFPAASFRALAVLVVLASTLILQACGGPVEENAQPTPTPPAQAAITEPFGSGSGAGSAAQAAPGDVSTWKQAGNTLGGVTFSYRYPPSWSADLSYCASGAARGTSGNELPAGCAATDILVGQKALDIGNITGQSLTINGKQAVKQIASNTRSGIAASVYTLMVFDGTGVPLMGFSTSIGPGTDEATQKNITADLDKVASTLVVKK